MLLNDTLLRWLILDTLDFALKQAQRKREILSVFYVSAIETKKEKLSLYDKYNGKKATRRFNRDFEAVLPKMGESTENIIWFFSNEHFELYEKRAMLAHVTDDTNAQYLETYSLIHRTNMICVSVIDRYGMFDFKQIDAEVKKLDTAIQELKAELAIHAHERFQHVKNLLVALTTETDHVFSGIGYALTKRLNIHSLPHFGATWDIDNTINRNSFIGVPSHVSNNAIAFTAPLAFFEGNLIERFNYPIPAFR